MTTLNSVRGICGKKVQLKDMKNYIIPVHGRSPVSDMGWNFALLGLGYATHTRHFRLTGPTTIYATGELGATHVILGRLDEVLVIYTDSPAQIIEKFWERTKANCYFIGVLEGDEVMTVDDLYNGEIHYHYIEQ